MARPIPFVPPERDPSEELFHRLQHAPREHVEALLDVYTILQLLRDKGLLEIAKGVLGSGEKVLSIMTETMEMDEVVRTVRNLVIFLKVLGSIEPETLEHIVGALSRSLEDAKGEKPPGLFKLLRGVAKAPARRALVPVVTSIQSAGENLRVARRAHGKRPRTTRHSA